MAQAQDWEEVKAPVYELRYAGKSQEALNLARELKAKYAHDTHLRWRFTGVEGHIHGDMLNRDAQLKSYLEAYAIAEEAGDADMVRGSTIHLGNAYFYQNQFETALEYYRSVFDLAEEAGDNEDMAHSAQNMASCLIDLDRAEEAIDWLDLSYDHYATIQDTLSMAGVLQTFGFLYKELDQPRKALSYEMQWFDMATPDVDDLVMQYNNVSHTYL
ncbi:MAG: tetratricopeptide repeat protein, partial [Flavobacteriales bacterium]|nr:tetratricopeptide repeat protein [Flavobacteriales bacterium]